MQPPPLFILPLSGSVSNLNIYRPYQLSVLFDKFLAIVIVTGPSLEPACNHLSLVLDCGSLNLGHPDSGTDVSVMINAKSRANSSAHSAEHSLFYSNCILHFVTVEFFLNGQNFQ